MMRDEINIITCDLLVIGGGLAAAAAIKYVLEKDVNVCQVVKGSYGSIGRRGAGASCCGASETGSPRVTTTSVASEDLDRSSIPRQLQIPGPHPFAAAIARKHQPLPGADATRHHADAV